MPRHCRLAHTLHADRVMKVSEINNILHLDGSAMYPRTVSSIRRCCVGGWIRGENLLDLGRQVGRRVGRFARFHAIKCSHSLGSGSQSDENFLTC